MLKVETFCVRAGANFLSAVTNRYKIFDYLPGRMVHAVVKIRAGTGLTLAFLEYGRWLRCLLELARGKLLTMIDASECIYPTSPSRTEWDTRSILWRNKIGLNLFFLLNWLLNNGYKSSLFYYLLLLGKEHMDSYLSQRY